MTVLIEEVDNIGAFIQTIYNKTTNISDVSGLTYEIATNNEFVANTNKVSSETKINNKKIELNTNEDGLFHMTNKKQ